MPREHRYEEAAEKIIKDIGLNHETKVTIAEVAAMVDMPPSAVGRAMQVMQKVGAAELRTVFNGHGRESYWTIKEPLEAVKTRMDEMGILWSAWQEQNTPASAKPVAVKTINGTNGHHANGDSPFASLAALKKSEPKAELEVARTYRDQQAFIAEQVKAFEEKGLRFNPDAIEQVFDEERRRDLETLVKILPYVESLEKTNVRLEEQNKTMRAPIGELAALRGRVASQTEQIERLVREKGDMKEDVQRVLGQHRKEVEDYKEQISKLQNDIRVLKGTRALDSAVARATS